MRSLLRYKLKIDIFFKKSCSYIGCFTIGYRSGMVNSKSFVGKVLL